MPEDQGTMRGVLEEAERRQSLAALKQAKWLVCRPQGRWCFILR